MPLTIAHPLMLAALVWVADPAQVGTPSGPVSLPPQAPAAAAAEPPADYRIGPDDVLTIVFWRDQDLTADVTVRPDGKVTLPLLNDIHAAGLTPEELKDRITAAAQQFVEAPNVMVRVREIKSRFVTIIGEVGRQGPVPIVGPMNVVQLIGLAGGFTEFARVKDILIVRTVNGREQTFKFNYNDFKKGKNLKQNIPLLPGDQVVVP